MPASSTAASSTPSTVSNWVSNTNFPATMRETSRRSSIRRVCARALRSMAARPRARVCRVPLHASLHAILTEHARPAENGLEWRAQLVGEGGQELILQTIRLARLVEEDVLRRNRGHVRELHDQELVFGAELSVLLVRELEPAHRTPVAGAERRHQPAEQRKAARLHRVRQVELLPRHPDATRRAGREHVALERGERGAVRPLDPVPADACAPEGERRTRWDVERRAHLPRADQRAPRFPPRSRAARRPRGPRGARSTPRPGVAASRRGLRARPPAPSAARSCGTARRRRTPSSSAPAGPSARGRSRPRRASILAARRRRRRTP